MMTEPAAVGASRDRRNDREGKHEGGPTPGEKRDLRGHREHLLPSEPKVLERLRRLAIQTRRATLVPPPSREVALGDPRGGAMRR